MRSIYYQTLFKIGITRLIKNTLKLLKDKILETSPVAPSQPALPNFFPVNPVT